MFSRISFVLCAATANPAPTPAPDSVAQWGVCANLAECGKGLLCTNGACVPDPARTCKLTYEQCTDTADCCVLNDQAGANQAICVGTAYWKSCQMKGTVEAGHQCYANEQCATTLFCGNDGKCGAAPGTPAPTPGPSTVPQYQVCGADVQCMDGLKCSDGFCAKDPAKSCKLQYVQCASDAECCQATNYGCYGTLWWKSCQAKGVLGEGAQCFDSAQCKAPADKCNAGKCSATAGTAAPTPAPSTVAIYGTCSENAQCMEGTVCTNSQCVSAGLTTCTYPWGACASDADCCGFADVALYGCYGNQYWKACYQNGAVKTGQFCYNTAQCESGTCTANKCV